VILYHRGRGKRPRSSPHLSRLHGQVYWKRPRQSVGAREVGLGRVGLYGRPPRLCPFHTLSLKTYPCKHLSRPYDALTSTSSTKKEVEENRSNDVWALKTRVTVLPAKLDSTLVALKVTCCHCWVALELQALWICPMALPVLSKSRTVNVSWQPPKKLLLSPNHQ
jgi:hypothetical protein